MGMPLPEPPTDTIESVITIGDEDFRVWEFSFRKTPNFLDTSLVGAVGYSFKGYKLIVINSNLSVKNKKWTLDHEVAHMLRWQEGSNLPDTLWDEFECELMVIAKTSPEDFATIRQEVYEALRKFLLSGKNSRQRARMLVNYLRERTYDPTQEGRPEPIQLPKAALQNKQWWESITD